MLILAITLLAVLQPDVTYASPERELAWASKRRTPVLVLQPVALSAEGLAGVYHAAAAWNDTGYVRYLVAPMVQTPPEATRGVIPVLGDATVYPFTAISNERGYITGATI